MKRVTIYVMEIKEDCAVGKKLAKTRVNSKRQLSCDCMHVLTSNQNAPLLRYVKERKRFSNREIFLAESLDKGLVSKPDSEYMGHFTSITRKFNRYNRSKVIMDSYLGFVDLIFDLKVNLMIFVTDRE